MKIALCLSGQPRGLPISADYTMNNLVIPNDIQDIFIHTWYDPKMNGVAFDSAQPAQSNNLGGWMPDTDKFLQEKFSPKKMLCEFPKTFEHLSHLQDLPSAVQKRLASMFYSWNVSNQLKCQYELENNFKYDLVIRTRIDIGYMEPVNIKNIITDDYKNVIYVPNMHQWMRMGDSYPIKSGGTYSSMSDTFMVGSSENIDKACSIYDSFESIYHEIWPYAYGEAYTGYMIRGIHNIPVVMANIRYNLFRG